MPVENFRLASGRFVAKVPEFQQRLEQASHHERLLQRKAAFESKESFRVPSRCHLPLVAYRYRVNLCQTSRHPNSTEKINCTLRPKLPSLNWPAINSCFRAEAGIENPDHPEPTRHVSKMLRGDGHYKAVDC
jgi:hypothetical protein